MSDKQPEALRLADGTPSGCPIVWRREAAAELRRQHTELIAKDAAIAELVEALDGAYALAAGLGGAYRFQHQLVKLPRWHQSILDKASAAIAKHGAAS